MDIKEQKEYISSISKHTDRELQELQTYYARKQSDYLRSVRSSLNFFYILTVIAIIIFAIYVFNVVAEQNRLRENNRIENL